MAKLKFTKGELKRQRDALKQLRRYLPTLQLKKQQLQLEILQQGLILEARNQALLVKKASIDLWIGLLSEPAGDLKQFLSGQKIITHSRNIAGIDIPVFDKIEFEAAEYDLFAAPLWIDAAIEAFREVIILNEEVSIVAQGMAILRQELRVTNQRVNLFEKVKIPEAEENIRLIKIYIGDQMANAVGRCKIAKRKIEEMVLVGGLA
ncbi:MAG: V-type ATP synthase subunit D [Candidatus Omnitrophica bacterium CG11_big_fil_rev_8_21_14_0_20_41_12]|nr:MAG: V-type ATP synthase subunit D [Candidatus Omnitrophica bacterium CG11_big_fil_rev_8_21_14_0_20_41_12]